MSRKYTRVAYHLDARGTQHLPQHEIVAILRGADDLIMSDGSDRSDPKGRFLMIVRMWHGRVPTSKAKDYRQFVNARAIPDYRSMPGNLSVHILERTEGEVTHFITLTFWQDLESIRGFAGDEVEKAKYYPEDKDFLLEFEPEVVHYQVVGQG